MGVPRGTIRPGGSNHASDCRDPGPSGSRVRGMRAAQDPDIYWVDVEGGAATLIVTPSGASLLVDTGYPGDRDARRIFDAATKQAGLKKIDNLLITHYHTDHVGGVGVLAKLIPIGKFYDHGEAVSTRDPVDAQNWETYKTVAAGKRTTLKPGDQIPLQGVNIQVVDRKSV